MSQFEGVLTTTHNSASGFWFEYFRCAAVWELRGFWELLRVPSLLCFGDAHSNPRNVCGGDVEDVSVGVSEVGQSTCFVDHCGFGEMPSVHCFRKVLYQKVFEGSPSPARREEIPFFELRGSYVGASGNGWGNSDNTC